MGRFSYEDADRYGGQGGNSFFSLKDDGDVARVHLLGNDMGDFCGYAVHEVTIGDRRKYVNCLRSYNDPIDNCPFCASKKYPVKVRLFIPLYNIDAGEVQIWDRGKQFFRELSSYCARNPKVASVITEIERRGKKGDTSTTYGLYKVEDSDKTLEDFKDDIPEIIGGIVLDKSAEEMQYFLDRGSFPNDADDGDDEPVRRRSRDDRDDRRTMSRRGRSAEDDY